MPKKSRIVRPYDRTWEIIDELAEQSGRSPSELVHLACTLFRAASRDVRAIQRVAKTISHDRKTHSKPSGPLAGALRRATNRWRKKS